jgi:DNA-directed RNA polymerase specialized sigma24 family protein
MLLLYCGMEAMTHQEAAQRLDISVDAASKRWQRLTERVREWGIARDMLAL